MTDALHLTAESDKPRSVQRVAWFGGSFDPPHLGHLAIARAAQAALHLDQVLFAPVAAQPLKPQGSTASYEDRLEMTQLAVKDDPAFTVSIADAPRADGAPNYTWQTLTLLRDQFAPGSELFFLMGADSLTGFRNWRCACEIPFLAHLIVASRPGESLEDMEALLPEGLKLIAKDVEACGFGEASVDLHSYALRDQTGRSAAFYLLPGLEIEISATEIRQQIWQPSPARVEAYSALPIPVSDYIRSRCLYQ